MMKIFKILGIVLCVILLVLSLNIIKSLNTSERVNVVKSEGILQTGEVAKNIQYLKPEDIEVALDEWQASPPVCFKSKLSDSKSFGLSSLATNKNHLAIGDPDANRVVVYTWNKDGQWLRQREISPPKDSVASRVGSGFGYELALDGNILVISAYEKKDSSELINPKDFQPYQSNNQSTYYISESIYTTKVDQEAEIEQIEIPIMGLRRSYPMSVIAADEGTIAWSTIKEKKADKLGLQVNLLSDDNIWHISPPQDDRLYDFTGNIALKDNFLLISAIEFPGIGFAFLFDLNTPNNKPKKLSIPDVFLGATVAISNKFAATGDYLVDGYRGSSIYTGSNIRQWPQKTLIRRIEDGSTTAIDGVGKLYLDGNVLARMRYRSADNETKPLLEIFKLDHNATPRLIYKRTDIDRAFLQNNLLITVEDIKRIAYNNAVRRLLSKPTDIERALLKKKLSNIEKIESSVKICTQQLG